MTTLLGRRIRVLQVIPNYGTGGAERVSAEIATRLDPDVFDVGAVSFFNDIIPDIQESLDQAAIRTWFLGKRRGPDPRICMRLDQVVRTFEPDVVHTHRNALLYALPTEMCRRVPVKVHTIHNLAEREGGRVRRWVSRLAFRAGVVPVSIGREVTRSIRATYGTSVVPLIMNGIPMPSGTKPRDESLRALLGLREEDFVFVTIGRLERQKNHEILLRAFAKGFGDKVNARLLIVGGGELQPDLEKRISDLRLEHQVKLLGHRSDVGDLLALADVFVLSSSWEGNPLVVMEAMAAGCPVVSTAVGSIPELVTNEVEGLLVPADDENRLVQAMHLMMTDDVSRRRMASAAAQRATEEFSADRMVNEYAQLFLGLVDDAMRGRQKSLL